MRTQTIGVPHKANCRCSICMARRGEHRRTPTFSVRLDEELQEFIRQQPEGARAYLERLVQKDKERRKKRG